MIRYINTKTKKYGVETIDEVDSKDFKTKRSFNKELASLVSNHQFAGVSVYISIRCDKTWNEK